MIINIHIIFIRNHFFLFLDFFSAVFHKVSEFDQAISQSHTADQPTAPSGNDFKQLICTDMYTHGLAILRPIIEDKHGSPF